MEDLAKHVVVHAVHADAITQRQGGIQCKALDIGTNSDLASTVFAVVEEITYDTVRLEVEHVEVSAHCRASKCLAGGFPLVLTRGVPGTGPNGKSLSRRDDPVEGIQGGPINDCRLVADKHLPGVFKRADHHGPGIAQADLKDRLAIFPPPFLADSGVVFS